MSAKKSTIVQYSTPNSKSPGKGVSDQERIQLAFPGSPIYDTSATVVLPNHQDQTPYSITDAGLKELYNNAILQGSISLGNMFNEAVKMDYVGNDEGSLDILEVDTGGEGKPMTPYGPNITSPEGVDASTQPEYTGDIPDIEKRNNFGSSYDSYLNPKQTRDKIASQKIGDYVLGNSIPKSQLI